MKAVVHKRYGPPEEMEMVDLPKPEPGRGQVLVRVRACGLNGSDWEFKTGRPGYARIGGLFRPRKKVLGSDIAGTVEALGKGVSEFRVGDAVFGDILEYQGGLAEYANAPAKQLMLMPRGLDFTIAAAIPQAAVVAHQAMTRPGPLPAGSRVLINGAGGGAGTFAVQIARMAGLKITAIDRDHKLEPLRGLGAHETFDCEAVDFATMGLPYHRIIDMVASRPPRKVARALIKGGTYWAVGGRLRTVLRIFVGGRLIRGKTVAVLGVQLTRDALAQVMPLIERGVVQPKVDRVYPLKEAPAALRRMGDGKAFGKVVVRIV